MANRSRRLFCSASSCKLPIRKGDLYTMFNNNNKIWLDRLRADGSPGHIVCFRHFSRKQYTRRAKGHKALVLKADAFPDQQILSCRFCLDQSVGMERLQTVPNSHPDTLTLQDIVDTIGIRVQPEVDGISTLICLTCSSKVRYIKRIQRQFQESDLKMHQMQADLEEEQRKMLAETDDAQFVKFDVEKMLPDTEPDPASSVKTEVIPSPAEKPVRSDPVEDAIVTRFVIKEPGIITEEVVDSNSNSIFTIQTFDDHGFEDDKRWTEILSLEIEVKNWSPPVKKIKEEEIN
uniref:ZAD domain-containing protein n=1 Tax=Culex tarsalis TaxID=7177 RepID=A0A1Q3EWR2_CULTA